jgi:hypothetical protein
VARGEGADTYRDPREFYRITYMTGGLRKVLQSAIERLAGKGGDPVIGQNTEVLREGSARWHRSARGPLRPCDRE